MPRLLIQFEDNFCNCTAGCGVQCGCRKAGIKCPSICRNCEGVPPGEDEIPDKDVPARTKKQNFEEIIFQVKN